MNRIRHAYVVTDAAGGGTSLTAVVGSLGAVAYTAAHMEVSRRLFTSTLDTRFPSDGVRADPTVTPRRGRR
jgi:hypothetical protein